MWLTYCKKLQTCWLMEAVNYACCLMDQRYRGARNRRLNLLVVSAAGTVILVEADWVVKRAIFADHDAADWRFAVQWSATSTSRAAVAEEAFGKMLERYSLLQQRTWHKNMKYDYGIEMKFRIKDIVRCEIGASGIASRAFTPSK